MTTDARPPESTETETHPPRRLSIWTRIWLSVLIGVLLLVAGVAFRIWRLADLDEQLTISPEITIITEPLTPDGRFVDYVAALNAEASQGVTPENNAAVPLLRAFGPDILDPKFRSQYYELLGIDPLPAGDRYFVEWDTFLTSSAASPSTSSTGSEQPLSNQYWEALRRPWSPDEFPETAAWLDANETALQRITEASSRPIYYSPELTSDDGAGLLSTPLSLNSALRSATRLLLGRANRKMQAGDLDRAWEDLFAVHRLARLAGQHGFLITDLVVVTCEAMASRPESALIHHPELSAEQARRCLSDLDALPPRRHLSETVDGIERRCLVDNVQSTIQCRDDHFAAEVLFGEEDKHAGRRSLLNAAVDWNETLRLMHTEVDKIVVALQQPDRSVRMAHLERIHADNEHLAITEAPVSHLLWRSLTGDRMQLSRGVGATLVLQTSGAMMPVSAAMDRADVRFQLTRLGFALAIYRADHDRFPDSLDELGPGILDEIPLDPFTSQPFIYQPTETGYRLYSVGANLIDDGGATLFSDAPGDDILIATPDAATSGE